MRYSLIIIAVGALLLTGCHVQTTNTNTVSNINTSTAAETPTRSSVNTNTSAQLGGKPDPNRIMDNSDAAEVWQLYGTAIDQEGDGSSLDDARLIMPEVIQRDDGTFVMYYTYTGPDGTAIRYAKSENGLDDWQDGSVALSPSRTQTDPNFTIGGPSVVKRADGSYRMYYRATPVFPQGNAPHYQILSATSDDGITFTEEDGLRIPNSYDDSTSPFSLIGHGSVYALADGTLAGIFSVNLNEDKGPSDLALITSADGITWDLQNYTILYENAHDPIVVNRDGTYVMYASYLSEYPIMATSSDGTTWPPESEKIGFTNSAGETYEYLRAGDQGAVVTRTGEIYLYGNYLNDIAVYILVSE